jgi:type IV pilus assembly protein PilQ
MIRKTPFPRVRKKFFLIFVISFFILNSESYGAEISVMRGLSVQQVGSQNLYIRVSGENLPCPKIAEEHPNMTVLLWEQVTLPSSQWKRMYNFPLLSSIKAQQKGNDIEMTIVHSNDLSLSWKSKINQQLPQRILILKKRNDNQMYDDNKPQKGKNKLTSDPVSISLRRALLSDVFRLFAEYWNLNLIVDDSVPEKEITLVLEDIPAMEAFSYLLKSHNLRFAMLGEKTLFIGTTEHLENIFRTKNTERFRLAYSNVKDVAKILKQATGIKKIIEDKRLNTLYITGDSEQLESVKHYIDLIDRPGNQVMIEARIVEVSDRASEEVASCLDSIYKNWMLTYNGKGSLGQIRYSKSSRKQLADEDPPLSGAVKKLDALFTMLEKDERGHVLAKPSVITVEGTRARIRLVQKYPYVSTRDEAGNPTYISEEVGPQLEITPFVGRDGVITIKLAIQTGEVISWREGARGELYPETSTREVETHVRIRDGEPFVIGGLFKEQKRKNHYKFPVLGDIPILKSIFSSQYVERDRNEVVIVVVPYILSFPQ